MGASRDDGLDIGALSGLRFFHGESPQTLEWLLGVGEVLRLHAGDVLIHAHQHNEFLFLVLEGLFRVELPGEADQVVTQIHPGETAGELSVLDGKPTVATVVAEEPSAVFAIHRVDLWELIGRSHHLARNLLHLLVQRIRKDDEALNDSFALQQKFAHTARMDSLTGLYNRHWLEEMLPRLIERAHTDGEPLGILMLDLDHFKHYNDSYGHLAGDEVLRVIGSIMLRHIRADDSVVRYGGEEFLVILPCLLMEEVLEVAERLCASIRRESLALFGWQGLPGVTVSIGMAMLKPGQGDEQVLSEADKALYRAKAEGRNRVVIA